MTTERVLTLAVGPQPFLDGEPAGVEEAAERGAAGPVELLAPPVRTEVTTAATDQAALRQLFEQHSPGVRRYLGDLLRDDAAADDATQETFVRAFHRLHSVREQARLSSWLFGIARNVFLEQCRQRKSLRRLLLVASDSDDSEPQDVAPTPDQVLLGAEAERVLIEALSHIGEPRKSALLLRLDHGLPYEDIAEIMGFSVAKVKNEIHRARLQLRTLLARYLGGSS